MESLALRRALLGCGLLSTLLYVAIDIAAALSWPGYSYRSQTISELSAIGAPTADLVAPLYALYDILLAAFGGGVWLAAGNRPPLRWCAGFIIAQGALGAGFALFPMHLRGMERGFTDTMHLVVVGLSILLLLAAMVTGAGAFGRRFRLYSIATILVVLALGYLTSRDLSEVQRNLATPWLGVKERIMIGSWILWLAVLSVTLSRERRLR